MKKYLFPIIFSSILGFLMAYLLLIQYDNLKSVSVSGYTSNLYYLQRGVYSSIESMKKNMSDISEYIYNKENGLYYTYIGISTTKKNIIKLQNYYKSKSLNTYIKEMTTDNQEFVTILKQYDKLLITTSDKQTINTICNQELSKYEELVNGEY